MSDKKIVLANPGNFDEFETSVKTFIIYLNIDIDIQKMFDERIFPVTDYVIQQKKRGRKKKVVEEDPNRDLKEGSIVQVKFRSNYYGTAIKTVKSKAKEFFRNATEIYIYIEGKLINFKVSGKGKLQMTGCKHISQAQKCVKWFWKYMEPHSDMYTFHDDGTHLTAYYNSVMRNIGFSLDFKVNRHALDTFINSGTSLISIFENTLGYAGVDIKFKIEDETELNEKFMIPCEEMKDGEVVSSLVPYSELIKMMKIRKKTQYVTFLVFQSGKVIMSGKDSMFMEGPYKCFLELMTMARPSIEDKTTDLTN